MSKLSPLPIDPLLGRVVAELKAANSLVIEAPPGAGKTTRVPRALLDAGFAGDGEILILEPRRLATRLAAGRVAEELGEKLGETVGYQIRFEELTSARTRIRFITEGLLARRLLSDRTLEGVSVVILDEFHERNLHGDLALGLLRKLQQENRPDLRLVIMSATLDAAPVASFLGCASLRSEGRQFPIDIDYLDRPDDRPLATQVALALRRLVREGLDGDVLVFLPGAAEIRRAREACEAAARDADLLLLPLYGELAREEQDRAIRPADRRKVILATNVAETSVTIPGIAAVIDSGLARTAGHSPWSGLPTLSTAPISQASATQRAGRAGRTRAGRCLRLYTKADFERRPEHEMPEIRRLDLAEPVLALRAAGVRDLSSFAWLDPPTEASLSAADSLLQRLSAVTKQGELTEVGERMLAFPLHPRLARIVVEAESRGVGESGATVAALVAERDIRRRASSPAGSPPRHDLATGDSDLLALLDLFDEASDARFQREALRRMGLDPAATLSVERARRQLSRRLRRGDEPNAGAEELLISILTGYPDRLARRRSVAAHLERTSGGNLILAGGGTASLAETSVVRDAPFVVVVDAEQRPRQGIVVRLASGIEPEWLLDLYPDSISDINDAVWNAKAERVEAVGRLTYDGLVLDEGPAQLDPSALSKVLAEAALSKGPHAFIQDDALDVFLARTQCVASVVPNFPALTVEDARKALVAACEGATSFAELRDGRILASLEASLTGEERAMLAQMAPLRVRLRKGRDVKIRYEPGNLPYIASRLQDFFGMQETPSIAEGKVPLVLQLLAPNQRAVQVTRDLAGFWERHYPSLRRSLMRRYPRHDWPENPV